jgi:parvulin-like peptidyl-prolyl cis-trans isomerase-like protein
MLRLRTLIREPLVQFLGIGGLLFLLFEGRGTRSAAGPARIVVTPVAVERLAGGFARVWERRPTDAELKGLVDDYVKEEAAAREAAAIGLDKDDAVIRGRLRQKLELAVEGAADAAPPNDGELQAWLEAHPAAFRAEPQIAFRQVYVSRERRGADARTDAERLLRRLRAAGPGVATAGLGDSTLLPAEQPLAPLGAVARAFGADFARAAFALEPGAWSGPVESPYGLHLVLVREKTTARTPTLAELRPQLEHEVVKDRKQRQLEALYDRLLRKYPVTIEMPKDGAASAPAGRP